MEKTGNVSAAAAPDPPAPSPPEEASDSPIYDALARLWVQQGREPPGAPRLPPGPAEDLFHRD